MPRPRRPKYVPYTGPIPAAEVLAVALLDLIAGGGFAGDLWAELLEVSQDEVPHLLSLLPMPTPVELEQARHAVKDPGGYLVDLNHWLRDVEVLLNRLRGVENELDRLRAL